MIELQPVLGEREGFLPLLLEADESEPVVRSYLDEGELFAIADDGVEVGAVLLITQERALEIKNIAVDEDARGRGIGAAAIDAIADLGRDRGHDKLLVGTANSSTDVLRFYQRCGFRIVGVRRGFFDAYPEEIWEDGVRARDFIEMELELVHP